MKLTREEVLNLAAGHELDDLVQEHVFGFQGACEDNVWYVVPSLPYSTDNSSARIVLRDLPLREDERFIVNRSGSGWLAKFDCRERNRKYRPRTPGIHEANAETMPLAVCRAALLAFISLATTSVPTAAISE